MYAFQLVFVSLRCRARHRGSVAHSHRSHVVVRRVVRASFRATQHKFTVYFYLFFSLFVLCIRSRDSCGKYELNSSVCNIVLWFLHDRESPVCAACGRSCVDLHLFSFRFVSNFLSLRLMLATNDERRKVD